MQVFLARINGETRRPDGGHYHLTWSLHSGETIPESWKTENEQKENAIVHYHSRHANNLIADVLDNPDSAASCIMFETPIAIKVKPALVTTNPRTGQRIHHYMPRSYNAQSPGVPKL